MRAPRGVRVREEMQDVDTGPRRETLGRQDEIAVRTEGLPAREPEGRR